MAASAGGRVSQHALRSRHEAAKPVAVTLAVVAIVDAPVEVDAPPVGVVEVVLLPELAPPPPSGRGVSSPKRPPHATPAAKVTASPKGMILETVMNDLERRRDTSAR
jgi:hypothetical protein